MDLVNMTKELIRIGWQHLIMIQEHKFAKMKQIAFMKWYSKIIEYRFHHMLPYLITILITRFCANTMRFSFDGYVDPQRRI